MKKLHSFYLFFYRIIGLIFLLGLIFAIIWYASSLLFFTFNKNWTIPLIISPTQDKVLNHQAQLASFQQNFEKQKIELQNAELSLENKKNLLNTSISLHKRLLSTVLQESKRYANDSASVFNIVNEKKQYAKDNQQIIKDSNESAKSIEQELSSGLITKQEALSRRLELHSLNSNLLNEKARELELNNQGNQLNSASKTLRGGSSNLDAIQIASKLADINILIGQLKIDITTIQLNIESLKRTIHESGRVLQVLKNSPYYLALQNSINVAFIPYDNLKNVKENTPIYACTLQMIICHQAGKVNKIYDAEEYARHPMFKTDIKGKLLGVTFNNLEDSQNQVIFVGNKPLLF